MVEEFIEKHRKLLELERNEEVIQSKLIVETSPKLLEEKNMCLRKLQFTNIFTGLYGRTILEFQGMDNAEKSNSKRVFSPGDIVGIYNDSSRTESSTEIGTGIFYKYDKMSLQIALDKDIDKEEIMENLDEIKYRLVKLSSEITFSRLKAGLNYLEKRSNPLCGDYLIDILLGSMPISSLKSCGYVEQLQFVNNNLNDSQKEAVQFALNRSDVAIIQGPPGTGKTTVAVEIIMQILLSDAVYNKNQPLKILVCTPSNIALDNLAEKFLQQHTNSMNKNKKKVSLLRLGHSARVLPSLVGISIDYRLSTSDQSELIREVRSQIDNLMSQQYRSSAKQGNKKVVKWREIKDLRKELQQRELKAVREVLRNADIVLSTLTGLRSNRSLPLDEFEFDVVIIDEASQAIEAACWLAIPRGKKLILAGDHKQLPPTVLSEEAAKEGLGVSLMERLLDRFPASEISRMLTIQYRMHSDIMRWSSDTFYESQLIADPAVAGHVLNDICMYKYGDENDVFSPLLFIDTAGCDLLELDASDEESKGNVGEAQLVAAYVGELSLKLDIRSDQIGVITPYSRQVQLIKECLGRKNDGNSLDVGSIEVSTVDGFQGREKEVIIMSLVRSNPSGTIGFLAEHRRLNVALTRSKRHLCVIADSSTINKSTDSVLKSLIEYWNSTAEVRSAHSYVYEHNITPGDCVKPIKNPSKSSISSAKNTNRKRTEHEDAMLIERLKSFQRNESKMTIEFSSKLNAKQRAMLHDMAESMHLSHTSVGEGRCRRLIISKPTATEMLSDNNSSVSENYPLETNVVVCDQITTDKTPSIVEEFEINDSCEEVNSSKNDDDDDDDANSLLETTDEYQSGNYSSSTVQNNTPSIMATNKGLSSNEHNELQSVRKEGNNNTKKQQPKTKKKSANQKSQTLKVAENVPDDFDSMLEHFQNFDKHCQHPEKCKTPTSVLGFNCRFCQKRFCVAHVQPEVHQCIKATTAAWKTASSNGPAKTVTYSQQIRHNQISRILNKKLNDMASERKGHKDKKN